MYLGDFRATVLSALIGSSLLGENWAPSTLKLSSTPQSTESLPKGAESNSYRPVVLWHGLGDNYNSSGMNRVTQLIQEMYPGVFVHSIAIDSDPSRDENKSLFGDANDEVDLACEQIANISQLKDGFDAIGFSQGGVLTRALIERCSAARVHNFITFGSPHMGVMELPVCRDEKDWICKRRNAFLKKQVWHESIQNTVIPAQYFRDPYEYQKYLDHSHFLADVNNEAGGFNASYVENLSNINKFVLVAFLKDQTVVPKNSAWFEDINPCNGAPIPYDDTDLYKGDYIGLKKLDLDQKLVFLNIDDAHMRIPDTFLVDIAQKYLGSPLA